MLSEEGRCPVLDVKPADDHLKRHYVAPVLTTHGEVGALTRGGVTSLSSDAGTNMMKV